MQEMRYDELERRASETAQKDIFAKMETMVRVNDVVKEMIAEEKAFVLTAEEEEMLREFRRFKLRMRADRPMTFMWKTRRDPGIVIAQNTAEIVHPNTVPTEGV